MEAGLTPERFEQLLGELTPELRDELRRLKSAWEQACAKIDFAQRALDALPEELYIKDTQTRFVFANKTTAAFNHLGVDELIGKTDFDLFPESEAEAYHAEEMNVLRSGAPLQKKPSTRGGEEGLRRWFQISKFPIYDDAGQLLGLVGMSRHLATQQQTELMLRAQTEILEMVAMNSPLEKVFQRITKLNDEQADGVFSSIMLLDREGRSFCDVISFSLPEEYTKQFIGLEIGDNRGSCGTACYRKQTVIVEDIEEDSRWEPYREAVRPFGFRSCWSAPIMRADGTVAGSFALYSKSVRKPTTFEAELFDLGAWLASIAIESHSAAEAVRIAAETDPLTGVMNRGMFNKRLQSRIYEADVDGGRFAVVFIDLNDFKLVNDRYGHRVGDTYLKVLGERIREIAGTDFIAARVGGDEFALIMDVADRSADIEGPVSEFMARLQQPVFAAGLNLSVSGCAGVAVYPDHGSTADLLLAHADDAMYHAKRNRLNRAQIYDGSIGQEDRSREMRISAIRKGIEADEFETDFQPQFNLSDGSIDGFEALVRWAHPELGRLNPSYFIGLAEETGLIVPLGEQVLLKACRDARQWQLETGQTISIAVNVSAHQFCDGAILKQVERALDETGLPPGLLELELTETVLADMSTAASVMSDLHRMGVRTALDDFGTGYSNLSALAAMPLHRLKIDRSIIQDIPVNSAAGSIASAIIAMGHKLDMQVLAEGVETSEQLDFLIENGCDAAQGFFLGRPVGFDQSLALLKADDRKRAGRF